MINLTMNTKELKSYLMKLGSIAKKTSKNTVERTVLFSRTANDSLQLSMAGNDHEIQIKIETDDRIESSFTLNLDKITNILKSLNDDIVSFSINDNNDILIESCMLKLNLKQPVNALEYPVFKQINNENNGFMTHKTILQKLTYCMPKKDYRSYLNGLLLDYSENTITIVATDGHRLAKKTFEVGSGFNNQQSIVPQFAINTILKICDKKQPLFIVINDTNDKVIFNQQIKDKKTGKHCFLGVTCNLIDGKYPDYKRIIPSHKDSFIFNKNVMETCLERIKPMANPKYNCVRIETDIENKKLTLTANSADTESASCDVCISTESKEKTEIGFNINYMLGALKYINDDKIRLMYGDDVSSALLIKDSEDYIHAIMPMRI